MVNPAAHQKLGFEIREVKTPAERRDFDRVLHRAFSRSHVEKIRTYDSWYRNHRRFVAYLEDGRAVGTGMLAQNNASGEHAVLRIAVEDDLRSQGIASGIVARIEEEAKKMGLTALVSYCTESLLRFYGRFGYKPVEREDISATDEPSWKIQKKL